MKNISNALFVSAILSMQLLWGGFTDNLNITSANVGWWDKKGTLHITVGFFSDKNIRQKKLGELKKLVGNLSLKERTFELNGIDVLSGTAFPNQFLLDALKGPSAKDIENKAKNITELWLWNLILRVEIPPTTQNTFKNLLPPGSLAFMPHITLGKIKKMNNFDLFKRLLEAENEELSKLKKIKFTINKNDVVEVGRSIAINLENKEGVVSRIDNIKAKLPGLERQLKSKPKSSQPALEKQLQQLHNSLQNLQANLQEKKPDKPKKLDFGPDFKIGKQYIYKGRTITLGMKEIQLIANVDAIVNAANKNLRYGSGIAGAIYKAGGRQKLQSELHKIKKLTPVGTAVIQRTIPGSNLRKKQNIKYIVNAVGPDCRTSEKNNWKVYLRNAYTNSLKEAENNNLTSIAFPAISVGIFKCPFEEATSIAAQAIKNYFDANPVSSIQNVVFVLYTDNSLNRYQVEFNTYFAKK